MSIFNYFIAAKPVGIWQDWELLILVPAPCGAVEECETDSGKDITFKWRSSRNECKDVKVTQDPKAWQCWVQYKKADS